MSDKRHSVKLHDEAYKLLIELRSYDKEPFSSVVIRVGEAYKENFGAV